MLMLFYWSGVLCLYGRSPDSGRTLGRSIFFVIGCILAICYIIFIFTRWLIRRMKREMPNVDAINYKEKLGNAIEFQGALWEIEIGTGLFKGANLYLKSPPTCIKHREVSIVWAKLPGDDWDCWYCPECKTKLTDDLSKSWPDSADKELYRRIREIKKDR